MITKRLFALQILFLAGFSSIFLLPKAPKDQPVGVNMALPEFLGEWWGQEAKITDKEIGTLGPETSFARRSYTNGRGDTVLVTIVLSGNDMSRSIHRPERCLPAQGWTLVDSRKARVALKKPDREQPETLKLMRLHSVRPILKEDVPAGANIPDKMYNLTYYWFAGYTDLTASHFERAFLDNRDRLMKGYNQRWAYITVASSITKDFRPFGRDERQTAAILEDFIKQLAPIVHGPSLKGGG